MAALQEDDLVVLADAELRVARGDLLHLLLALLGPLLDRRDHAFFERLLQALADGPPEHHHPGGHRRRRDVVDDVPRRIDLDVGAAAGP